MASSVSSKKCTSSNQRSSRECNSTYSKSNEDSKKFSYTSSTNRSRGYSDIVSTSNNSDNNRAPKLPYFVDRVRERDRIRCLHKTSGRKHKRHTRSITPRPSRSRESTKSRSSSREIHRSRFKLTRPRDSSKSRSSSREIHKSGSHSHRRLSRDRYRGSRRSSRHRKRENRRSTSNEYRHHVSRSSNYRRSKTRSRSKSRENDNETKTQIIAIPVPIHEFPPFGFSRWQPPHPFGLRTALPPTGPKPFPLSQASMRQAMDMFRRRPMPMMDMFRRRPMPMMNAYRPPPMSMMNAYRPPPMSMMNAYRPVLPPFHNMDLLSTTFNKTDTQRKK